MPSFLVLKVLSSSVQESEERMLLVIMYVRSLHFGDIVKYFILKPLPVRRDKILEYDHLEAMHTDLITQLAEKDRQYRTYVNTNVRQHHGRVLTYYMSGHSSEHAAAMQLPHMTAWSCTMSTRPCP